MVHAQGSPRHIVCKYADGGLLADRIAKTYEETGRGLPCGEVRELLLRFARALSALSKAGDVPLPVKPRKVLLDRSGTYLSPVARVPRRGRNLRDHLAQPGQSTAEDRAYIAPEQLSGRAVPVDQTYQYQLGLLAWHAISGTLPRPHDAVDAWKGDKLPTFVPSLPSLNASAPRCSPWLAAIVSRLTAAKPSSRFASLDELVSTLLKLPSEELGLVRQSYDDCLKNARKTFFGLVYTRLQERLSPEEWMKFSNVNWELQHENLAEAIALLLAFHALDDPAMEPTSLSRVARVHEHHGYGSTPGSFAQFGESLVDSVVETLQLEPGDAEILRDAWAAVLKPGLGYLARRVERDAAVRARS